MGLREGFLAVNLGGRNTGAGAFAAQYYSESKRTQGEGGRGILLHTIVRGRLM